MSARIEIAECPLEVSSPRGTAQKSDPCTCTSRSVSLIVFQATLAKNVWPPHSNLWSAQSQVSAALFYVRTVRSCGHGSVYRWYMGFLPANKGLAMLSRSEIALAVARSARPVPPPIKSSPWLYQSKTAAFSPKVALPEQHFTYCHCITTYVGTYNN